MEVFFKPSFIKDFKALPTPVKQETRKIFTEVFPCLHNLYDLKGYDLKTITGFKNYYRIRLGHYRVGFKKENHSIIFMRVRHRKDIYKHFP